MDLQPWGIFGALLEPIEGGYNSRNWYVRAGDRRFVAKWVQGTLDAVEAGLWIAEQLEARGFRAGGPLRTLSGALTAPVEGGWLALLRFVPGELVAGDTPDELRVRGRILGRVHRLLADVPAPAVLAATGGAIDLDAPLLERAPWVRPAVEEAFAALAAAPPLTRGIIHNDGAEVRQDVRTGEYAMIDWGAAAYAPLVSDVGTVRWHFQAAAGRPAVDFAPFLDGYLEEAPIAAAELDQIEIFVRLRAAMTGWYFASRLQEGVTTGADEAWNVAGLEQARRLWEGLAHAL